MSGNWRCLAWTGLFKAFWSPIWSYLAFIRFLEGVWKASWRCLVGTGLFKAFKSVPGPIQLGCKRPKIIGGIHIDLDRRLCSRCLLGCVCDLLFLPILFALFGACCGDFGFLYCQVLWISSRWIARRPCLGKRWGGHFVCRVLWWLLRWRHVHLMSGVL